MPNVFKDFSVSESSSNFAGVLAGRFTIRLHTISKKRDELPSV